MFLTIFTTEAITTFINNITQFPTLIFTGLLIFVSLYWVVSLLGLVGMDSLDVDVPDMTGDGDFGGNYGHHGHDGHQVEAGFIASLLMRFGLQGVPILVILTLFSLAGWLISYVLMDGVALLTGKTGLGVILYYGLALVVLLITIWLSLEVTSLVVKPIRKLIKAPPERTANSMLGKVATVRTLTVDAKHGEAVIEENGATLILKVRAFEQSFVMGDKVVLMEYFPMDNSYRVVGED